MRLFGRRAWGRALFAVPVTRAVTAVTVACDLKSPGFHEPCRFDSGLGQDFWRNIRR